MLSVLQFICLSVCPDSTHTHTVIIMSTADLMYSKIDTDNSGSIDRAEWDAVFKNFDKDGKCARWGHH